MVNKKGWLRVIEASIAVMLILGAVLFLIQTGSRQINQKDLTEDARALLNEIARNNELRKAILEYNTNNNDQKNSETIAKINDYVNERINRASVKTSSVICEPEDFCELTPLPENAEEVYSAERIISSEVSLRNFEPKKIKIYLWRE